MLIEIGYVEAILGRETSIMSPLGAYIPHLVRLARRRVFTSGFHHRSFTPPLRGKRINMKTNHQSAKGTGLAFVVHARYQWPAASDSSPLDGGRNVHPNSNMKGLSLFSALICLSCSAAMSAAVEGKILSYGLFRFSGKEEIVKSPETTSGVTRVAPGTPILVAST